jgi:hypothetical protein
MGLRGVLKSSERFRRVMNEKTKTEHLATMGLSDAL